MPTFSNEPSSSRASFGDALVPHAHEFRTDTQVNFEKLEKVVDITKSWFCETQQAQVRDILKVLICKKAAASDDQLIEMFSDLKAIAGDGYKSRFTVMYGCNGSVYQIDLSPDCRESLAFKTSPPPKPSQDNPYRKYVWAAGAGAAAMAAYGYFRPDFREKVINNLCQEVYGLVNCSYDAGQGWREFALNFRLNEKIAEVVSISAERLADAAEFLRARASALRDPNCLFEFAAAIPATTVKHAYAIASWKLQLYATKMTWDGVSGWLFQSNSGNSSRLSCIVDTAGVYFSSVPYLHLKGIWTQACELVSQTRALSPPTEITRDVPSMASFLEGRP